MHLKRVFSGSPWEEKVAYCRAIKVGNNIYVSGTSSIKDGKVYAANDGYEQTKRCFEIIRESLQEFGADVHCIVRTRMFVTDISRWEEFSRAHFAVFKDNPPVTTMVEVKALIDPEMLIEIEAEAIVE
ncbi:RidA family protein [Candidatus Uabimicrobium sp. HlEnr_7]|uniref:RidA family protein n=1 Tax=Candidatus Uabimicrobium helgolandensis TaxID=3095367 RepID=UPI003558EF36